MSLSPVKHYYSRTSIDAWFKYLTQDWEGYFSQDQLKKGREIYLNNRIREIELTKDDAIIHSEISDKPYYAVISWGKMGPSVRSSSRKRERAKAIAVGGIYQIEELISDQLVELSLSEFLEEKDEEQQPSKEKQVSDDVSDALKDESETKAQSRPLILTFNGSDNGLGFDAYWLNPNGQKEAALTFGDDEGTPLSEDESESLIRLAMMARKAGFTLDKKTRRFLMPDIGRFIPFLSHVLPKWKSFFTIVRETEVKRLMQGIQSVEMDAFVSEIKEGDEESYSIEWKYQTGGRALNDFETKKLTKKMGQPVFLPDRGIVQLTDAQVNLLGKWKEFQRDAINKRVERYMILSLFGEGGYKLKLSKSLVAWRRKLFSEPSSVEMEADFLRDYQQKGLSWLIHVLNNGSHCLLADEMGLGKTAQVLAIFSYFRKKSDKPCIVFCPASVIPVWKLEVERFFPEMNIFQVAGQRSLADLKNQAPDIILCSYTQLRRNIDLFKEMRFSCCVLDEAQVIKNPDTKVSRACYSIKAEYRVAVTGTPIENHYKDIWSIFFFLMPGLLGNRSQFDKLVEQAGESFTQKLKNQLAPFILRRTKGEVMAELPDKNEMQLNCSMTDIQRKEYTRLVQDGIKRISDDNSLDTVQKRSFNFFALLTRLRQVCCDPGLLPWMDVDPNKSGKIQLLIEKLADIYATGHKVVIFSQFVGLIERLKVALEREFPELNLFTLTGKTVDRAKPVKGFQDADFPATILVSLKAGGTGITLHAADYVFLLDPWWNPSVEAQAIDRVHRLGQEKPVFVYRVITTGTIEERVQALQNEKQAMFKELIDDLKDVSEHKEHLKALKDLIALQH